MRKSLAPLLLAAALAITLGGAPYALPGRGPPDRANDKRAQVGMPAGEVQAIPGPGTAVPQSGGPGVVRAVSPADGGAAREGARRSVGSPPAARGYPARVKPAVEGGLALRWATGQAGERIPIAVTDGRVCEKDYWDPSYL